MKIAFIHYHLKTGGVTTVLRQQVEAIKDDCEVLVFTGTPPDQPFPADTITIKGLGYDVFCPNPPAPEDIAASIIKAIVSKFGGQCSVLHIHNPTLVKNKHFLSILKCLQQYNVRLFLQIHDFAEDGRPLSYYSDEYPSDCHYGVINSRDFGLLLKAGLKTDGLHKIFNIVKEFDLKPSDRSAQPRVLYPIRAIRRKNIGEAILLSLFFQKGESLVITLPPNSPVDINSYKGWKSFVERNALKVEFDAGLAHDFSDLVQTSVSLITTSITEGFGFSFIEPWLANKLVWGRRLAGICVDFERNGVRLEHMYEKLRVPISWVGEKDFFLKWHACILKICELLEFPMDTGRIQNAFSTIRDDGTIDFGLLDEAFQKKIILHTLSHEYALKTLIRLNPFLSAPGYVANPDLLIKHNRLAVKKNYNLALYRERLLEIYSRVANVSVNQHLDKSTILSHFLNLNKFSLLKWGEYVD
jgi:hypothetical protein